MKAYFIYNTKKKKIQTIKFIVGFIGAEVPKKSQQPLNQYNYKTLSYDYLQDLPRLAKSISESHTCTILDGKKVHVIDPIFTQ